MLERLRSQIGTAGLVVAIVALVAALGGGAYAATGGNSGKATASAKQGKQGKQGKPGKTGPAGPAGPAGSAGAKGDTGAAGSNGSNGAPGAAGKSVVLVNETPANCGVEGGFTYEVQGSGNKNEVCNGENGTTGFTETLPSGKTETGIWSFNGYLMPEQEQNTETGALRVPISFAIPLSAPLLEANIINATKSKIDCGADATCLSALAAKCPATSESQPNSVRNPSAAPGFLCWYTSGSILNATFVLAFPNFSKAGTTLLFSIDAAQASGAGSWAVTAP
jgi:hypothetical protein